MYYEEDRVPFDEPDQGPEENAKDNNQDKKEAVV